MSGIYLPDIFFFRPVNPKNYFMRLFFFVLCCLCISSLHAQDPTQTVRGEVVNSITRQPLKGANVLLSADGFSNGTVSNEDGSFELTNVPSGRYKIQITYTGFAPFEDEMLVISGKSAFLKVVLAETPTMLSEVTLSETTEFEPGLTSISIEKTMRIPANFFDPVRMTTSYPSVVASNDQANSIIVRGNSPTGLLWRLNGTDIVNPNHLANAGTLGDKPVANGGGVNILSAQMLDKTDFYAGPLPAQYGNALAGALDMKLREGNKNERQYTAQASLIGIDLSAEGPFAGSKRSSYLANYRYSTVGLLSAMGIDFGDEAISFQDISFNLDFEGTKGGTFSFYGLGGMSSNSFTAKQPDEAEVDKDNFDIEYDASTFAVGGSYTKPLSKGFFFGGVTYSSSRQERDMMLVNDATVSPSQPRLDFLKMQHDLVSAHLKLSLKAGGNTLIEPGVLLNYSTNLLQLRRQQDHPVFPQDELTGPLRDDKGVHSTTIQPYVNSAIRLSPSVELSPSLRMIHYTNTDHTFVEPGVTLNYSFSGASVLAMSYRLTSQEQQPLLLRVNENAKLSPTRSHQTQLSYQQRIGSGITLRSEVYYQYLFDVPVSRFYSFSALNFQEISSMVYIPGYQTDLESEGEGENYGVTVSAEKSFFGNHYFIVGGSLYESTYTDFAGARHDTPFNGKFTFTGTYGKEWKKQSRNRTIGLNTRVLYLGGLRESRIIDESGNAGEPVYDVVDPYSERLKDYFRIDLRVSFRKDKPRYTRTFAIDIQNLSSNENEAYHYYDDTEEKIVTKYQLGIIPVLVYRIDF
jgi:hypothetical protein